MLNAVGCTSIVRCFLRMTKWQTVVALLLFVATLSSPHSQILKATDPLCVAARCSDIEVCVVSDGEPRCISKAKLIKLAKKHGIRHLHKPHTKLRKNHKHDDDHARHNRHRHSHLCSHDELVSMGGRLLQWFSDMHRIHSGRDKTLPAHKIACRRDVAWMFEQWDGDEDGFLSKDELMPLEGNEREACISHFIDMCDDVKVDDKISVDEWCDCFSFADDLLHEPPCHKSKHSVDPHMKGVFLPRCDLEGYYRPEQCHEGFCWCVDRFGREFDNSRIHGELPDCAQYASELDIEDKEDFLHRI